MAYLNQEKILLDEMAKAVQEEIDWEMMANMMVAVGYTKVNCGRMISFEEVEELKEWTNNHAKGRVQSRGQIWLFEKVEDAEWFTLKWVK